MTVRLLTGDCRAVLKTLPDASVQCVVTSPPYFGLRDYGVAGQIGLESSVDAYVAELVAVFREVGRVLRDDGTLWLNLGDSYSGYHGNKNVGDGVSLSDKPGYRENMRMSSVGDGLKPKDLIGIPWRAAFALQADGWWLRSEITWAKRAPMPESVRDRPTSATEKIFLLTKSAKYFYDAVAVAEPSVSGHGSGNGYRRDARRTHGQGSDKPYKPQPTRNMRNFWLLGPEPLPEAHFATFVTEIPERCIKAGTSEKGCCASCGAPWVRVVERSNPSLLAADHENTLGFNNNGKTSNPQSSKSLHRQKGGVYSSARVLGWQPSCSCDAGDPIPCTVLDPFAGAGTVSLVAERLGRDSIGIDLSETYVAMAAKRIRAECPMFTDVEVTA